MKLIRHIMSHLILIGFIFLLVLAYFYRAQLFPADIVSKIDHVAQRVAFWEKATRTSQSSETEVATTNTVPAPQQSAPPDVTVGQTDATADTIQPATEQATEQPASTEAAATATPSELPSPAVTSTEAQDMAPMAEQQQASTDQQVGNASSEELLDQARTKFNEGDITGAIATYQQLSTIDPGNPNVFGELGNVFYSQGKWKEAGVAYYEAANRLLDKGNAAQVQYLYRVIQGLDQESADKLKQRLGIN